MTLENTQPLFERLRSDIAAIRAEGDRTGSISNKPMRWEGTDINPNGWRLFGDLANDVEQILNAFSDPKERGT